tara:strand:- start:151 stop:324 length:174 start_codon:yes stop_codon:yes gene_type:complete
MGKEKSKVRKLASFINGKEKKKKEKRFLIAFRMTNSMSFRAKRRIYNTKLLLDTMSF